VSGVDATPPEAVATVSACGSVGTWGSEGEPIAARAAFQKFIENDPKPPVGE
jgi:hypothetical protein